MTRAALDADRAFVESVFFEMQRWLPLTLSTATINPARALDERLGVATVGQNEFRVFLRYDRGGVRA